MQCPGDDHLVPGTTQRESERLVTVRGATDGNPTPVGTPKSGESAVGVGDHARLLPDRVDPAIERDVVAHHRTDEIQTLFVTRRAERCGVCFPKC